jgi:hypothetical protein
LSNSGDSNFILSTGESIDPDQDIPGLGLGYDFCVNIYGSADVSPLGQWSEIEVRGILLFIIKEFFEQRQRGLTILCSENTSLPRKTSYR